MGSFASASRTIVIRASRDTLSLVAAAATLTFALAYVVHSKHDAQLPVAAPAALQQPGQPLQTQLQQAQQKPQQDWAGHLAELVPPTDTMPSEPMSSASLVVPKSQLALPALPGKPAAKTTRPCLDQPCAAKAPLPPLRRQPADVRKADAPPAPRKNLLGMLNPLTHLPDVSVIGRPFVYAGGAVTGWFKRF